MYLVEGRDPNEAWEKAISFAKNEGGGSGFELDGEAATEEFMGIRKLISIRSHLSNPDMSSDNPRDGTELTFSFFRFNGETDLTNLVEGEAVRVVYEADARWE